jgi:hypothetical protein
MTPTDIVEQEPATGCLARTRTYNSPPEHQAVTKANAHLDAHKLRSDAMLIEFIRLWRRLDNRTQRALLAAACAYDLGVDEK